MSVQYLCFMYVCMQTGKDCMCSYINVHTEYFPAQSAFVSLSLTLTVAPNPSCAIALLSMLQLLLAPLPLLRLLPPPLSRWTTPLLHLTPHLTGNQSDVGVLYWISAQTKLFSVCDPLKSTN